MGKPLAYLITWTVRGTWLHGDPRGSADRSHNRFGTPYLEADSRREDDNHDRLSDPVCVLDAAQREVVRQSIEKTCDHRNWKIHALTVRSNHVHVVVTANATPEEVMQDLKSWATRALRENCPDQFHRGVWTRHGSTRYLFDPRAVDGAVVYVNSHERHPRAHARGS